MKRFLVVLILISLYGLSAAWVKTGDTTDELLQSLNSNLTTTEIEFTLDGYDLESIDRDGIKWQLLTHPTGGELMVPGKPDIPLFSRLVAIPAESDVKWNIIEYEEIVITDILLYPQGELLSDNEGGGESFIIDEDFYNSDVEFPGSLVMIGEEAVLRDFHVVNFTVQPFQYNPGSRELRIITSLRVNLSAEGGFNSRGDRKLSKAFEPIYRSVIINYDQIRERDPEYQQSCYLFIAPNNTTVASYLTYLTDWKEEKGFEVHSVNTSHTGTSTTSIKNYIQSAYNTWENPPDYVCLVGDANGTYAIPTWFENWSGYNGEGDHPYSQLDGTDVLADVMIGRLSFNNTSELQTLISKIIGYESTPLMSNTTWYRRALLVGDPSSSGQSTINTCKAVKETILDYDASFQFNEVYSGDYDGLMNAGINAGVGFMCYRGYIGMSGWDTTDINSLNNGFMLPFASILTCGTGGFSGTNCRSEYFAKAGTATTPKGAIGAIGTATSGTHTCFNNCVTIGIFHGIFNDDIFSMGGALVRGKLNLYMNYPQNPSNAVNIFSHWNNLMGDPGLELYTDIPRAIEVNYEEEVNTGLDFLEVNVSLISGQGVPGACVSLLQSTHSSYGFTDANGSVFVALNELIAGEVTVTVTGHDCLPYQGILTIGNTVSLVTVESMEIDDDNFGNSNGNGDEICNPGETVELWINMHNYGTTTQNNVNMIMRSSSPYILITSSSVNFGTINAGETVEAPSAYIVEIAENTPGGIGILCSMDISATGDGWIDALELEISGPMLDYDHYTVSGGNAILDPGETAQVYITLNNLGDLPAYSVMAELTCNDNRLTVIDGLGSFGNIVMGGTGNNNGNRFELSADSQILPGSQIPVMLQITADGYSTSTSFLISIGVVNETDPLGADAYGYYIYDDEDDEYSLVPSYNWLEIDPAYGGPGTDTGLYEPGDTGAITTLNLPFIMQFYGVDYNQITICTNGWAAPGVTEQTGFMNWHVPGPGGPSPMIAAFWDDLKCTSGNICYYNDSANHQYIIEWSRLQNEYNNALETFQMIIRNPVFYPSQTGDSDILIMYNDINNVNSGYYRADHGQYCTVGIEDHTGEIGLEYTYNNTYPDAARSLEDGMALLITTNSPAILEPPAAVLNTEEFQFILQPGEVSYDFLEIGNSGESSLVFNLSKDYQSSRESGGPDGYGYLWSDSDEPGGPEYNWIDISSYGSQVSFSGNDTGTELMDIGFSFNFYGEEYTQFLINPNGWIGFGADNPGWANTSLPNPDSPKPALFPFWDDLHPEIGGNGGGEVYYYSDGTELIVMFHQVEHYAGQYNGTYDFEMIINNTGGIKFQYHTLAGDIDTNTIGIQDENGVIALMVSYNGYYLHEDMAIEFMRIIDWLDISQTAGLVGSGENQQITLTVDTSDLILGAYICNLLLTTNDPNMSSLIIPVDLNVGGQVVNYGDVDSNGAVEAYDASICLQYFVGMDPIPLIDPIPWELIRIMAADVDGNGAVESYDASLILQYFVGIIDVFPVENSMRRTGGNSSSRSINNRLKTEETDQRKSIPDKKTP
ncbi:MAG: hypothetical protein K9N06_03640 [Candidatus Cloacimonetes bacterium]|nr:hypothetical protein [Candidatus Cloacimonadota bacterium]